LFWIRVEKPGNITNLNPIENILADMQGDIYKMMQAVTRKGLIKNVKSDMVLDKPSYLKHATSLHV